MTKTTNLGLSIYDEASGSAITHSIFRLAIAGNTSNMTIVDNFAGETSASILSLQSNAFTHVPASYISTNYYEASISTITSYVTNMFINLRLNATITGATTINISELGIKTLKKINVEGNLADLSSGDLKLNRNYLFRYDGTYFVLIGSDTADQISISGSSGNYVSISGSNVLQDSGVPVLTGITTGSFNKVEIDSYGRVTAGSIVTYQTVSSISGSGVMSNTTGSEVRHNTSGITSGSYNKVQVDAYGHIIAGSAISYTSPIIITNNVVSINNTSIWMPEAKPLTSNSKDDEFDISSGSSLNISKWSILSNGSSLESCDIQNNGLRLIPSIVNNNEICGIFQEIPSGGSFVAWTRVDALSSISANDLKCGIFVGYETSSSPTTGSIITCSFSSGTFGTGQQIEIWDNYNTYSGSFVNSAYPILVLTNWIRARVNGSSLNVDYSSDGNYWVNNCNNQEMGFTPTHVGLFAYTSEGSIQPSVYFPFFRIVENDEMGQVMNGRKILVSYQ